MCIAAVEDNIHKCVCWLCADGASGENEFLYNKLNDFRVDSDDGKKPTFTFRLAGIGRVCREAWILAAGFPNRNNSRVRMLEATIRQGKPLPMPARKNSCGRVTNTSFALAFLQNYILENSQRSPVTTELCVIWLGMSLYIKYFLSFPSLIVNQ